MIFVTQASRGNTQQYATTTGSFAPNPYLLLHASHPVDWYPCGDEAFFEKARKREQPIFSFHRLLHIHWLPCHGAGIVSDPNIARHPKSLFPFSLNGLRRRPILTAYTSPTRSTTGKRGLAAECRAHARSKPFCRRHYFPLRTNLSLS